MEFSHIPAHAALSEDIQKTHIEVMKHLIKASRLMEASYQCNNEEAWLRLSVVCKKVWEEIKNAR